jgi:hypothetical protein
VAVAAEGPDGALQVDSAALGSSGAWTKQTVGAAGTALAPPALAAVPNGSFAIAVQGPRQSLDVYLNAGGSKWTREVLAGVKSTVAAPSIAALANDELVVTAESTGGSIRAYLGAPGSTRWRSSTVAPAGSAVASPSPAGSIGGEVLISVEAPHGGLATYAGAFTAAGWTDAPVPAGALAGPTATATLPNGDGMVAAEGGRGRLEFAFNTLGTPTWGSATVAAAEALSGPPALAAPGTSSNAGRTDPVTCAVPRLHGLTEAAARRALNAALCTLGKIHAPRRVPRRHVLHVTAQTPRAGTKHPDGYLVGMTVA